jgi:hypothetical protein
LTVLGGIGVNFVVSLPSLSFSGTFMPAYPLARRILLNDHLRRWIGRVRGCGHHFVPVVLHYWLALAEADSTPLDDRTIFVHSIRPPRAATPGGFGSLRGTCAPGDRLAEHPGPPGDRRVGSLRQPGRLRVLAQGHQRGKSGGSSAISATATCSMSPSTWRRRPSLRHSCFSGFRWPASVRGPRDGRVRIAVAVARERA